VKNVELFDHLLHVQMDWLSDTEARLALLRRASKVFSRVQQQLDQFQVQSSLEICLCNYTVVHFIFYYNSCISWWVFTRFVSVETLMNILQTVIKFTASPQLCLQLLQCYLQLRIIVADPLPAVRSIELFVCNFCKSRPMFIFSILLGNSLMNLWAVNLLIPAHLDQNFNFSFRIQRISFRCIFITSKLTP